MGILPRLVSIMIILTACFSTPPPQRISKSRWVECWTLCGKADNLVSADAISCYCKGGVKVNKEEPEPETAPEPPIKTFEIFDWLKN